MKNFLKSILSSCLGIFFALILFFGVLTLIGVNMASKAEDKVKVKTNSVLEFTFETPIPEKTNNVAVSAFDFESKEQVGLYKIVKAIEAAKTDSKIKGILLNFKGSQGGLAKKATIRNAIIDFKESGKFVNSYGDYYSQGQYYLASSADKITVSPVGGVDFHGFGQVGLFYKNMLDKLGIDFQTFYVGKYKGASESMRLTEFSKDNKYQTHEYLNALYNNVVNDIASSRSISNADLKKMSNEALLRSSDDALKYKMVDKVGYYSDVLDNLRTKLGLEEKEKVNFVAIEKYAASVKTSKTLSSKNRIAVVNAEGMIVMGDKEGGLISGETYTKMIRKIRNDEKVKALVLRVNSGGGSALASDLIWKEIDLFKKSGRPVVVSMGDVAASGGYYIACSADSILAEKNTITGSIGVVGGIWSFHDFLKGKLGITMDTVKTSKFAAMSNVYDLTDEEKAIIQSSVKTMYDTFVSRVADGRGMNVAAVHEVAQGRVWAAEDALEAGLVDKIGTLDDAIDIAADLAGIEKYRLKSYPLSKTKIEKIIEKITGENVAQISIIDNELNSIIPDYKKYKLLSKMKGPIAITTFDFDFE